MICHKKHRYLSEYEALPYAQDNNNGDRHICAGCAYEEGLKEFKKKSNHVQKILTAISGKIPEMKNQYNLTEDTLDSIKLFANEFDSINNDYEKLMNLDKNHSFPYSKLNQELEIISLKLSKLHEKLNNLLQ